MSRIVMVTRNDISFRPTELRLCFALCSSPSATSDPAKQKKCPLTSLQKDDQRGGPVSSLHAVLLQATCLKCIAGVDSKMYA